MTEQTTAQPKPSTPPIKASEESTEKQLVLAKKQGDAYAEALKAMNEESGAQMQRAGEYEAAIVVEEAEGMWSFQNGELQWANPTELCPEGWLPSGVLGLLCPVASNGRFNLLTRF